MRSIHQLIIQRGDQAFLVRLRCAWLERLKPKLEIQTNGDEQLYPNKIGNFHKCLPQNSLGEVDVHAYKLLVNAIQSRNFKALKSVPTAGSFRIASPMGGEAFSLSGPDAKAVSIATPYSFGSADLAYEMAELYWMAILRDIPFSDYEASPQVNEAVIDLSRLQEHYPLKRQEKIAPKNLFLPDYPKVNKGARVSQFLLQDYFYDGIKINQRVKFPLAFNNSEGVDFLTDYDEWLAAQKGFPEGSIPGEPRLNPSSRYIINMRDMGWNAYESSVISTYLKAALILFGYGREALDPGNPYKSVTNIGGFGTFDFAHLMRLLGHVMTVSQFNYLKWHYRVLRPESYGGRVDNHLRGAANYPIHEVLLNSSVLEKIYKYNLEINCRRNIKKHKGSYLLPCILGEGSPTHPSYPAGHGVSAGIGVTLLKAWFDEEYILPDSLTVKTNKDGTSIEPYIAGKDGPELTIGGELNKLAYNITWGRNMSGIHYHMDGFEGNQLGEEIAIRILQEEKITYGEDFEGYKLTKFNGEEIWI